MAARNRAKCLFAQLVSQDRIKTRGKLGRAHQIRERHGHYLDLRHDYPQLESRWRKPT